MVGQQVAGLRVVGRPIAFRQHRLVPNFPVALEAIENVFVPLLEIRSLAGILVDVKQELVAGNPQVLPVAVANGALCPGLEAPEQLARMRRCAVDQRRQQILAVRRISLVRLGAGGTQQCRHPVHGDSYLLRHRARRHSARPAHDGWYAKAAFEKLPLHPAEWPYLGEALAAIVAGKDHDRVPGETANVQSLQNPAYVSVQALHHGDVGFLRAAVTMHEVLYAFRLHLVVRALPRPMRRGEMEAQQERLLRSGIAFNRLNRPVTEKIGHITEALDRHLLLIKRRRRFGSVIEIVRRTAPYAEEVVVAAAFEGAEVRQKAQMPFANQRRCVACFLQQRWQRRVIGRQTDSFRALQIERLFQAHGQTVLIASGSKGRSRR
jgi:hypothetical protein